MSDSDDNANNLPDGQMENGHVPMEVEPNNSAERQSGWTNVNKVILFKSSLFRQVVLDRTTSSTSTYRRLIG
jgi:hypothetical protein